MAKITIKNARLSFPSIFQKSVFNGETSGKYEATFLFPKTDTKTYETIMKVINDGIAEHKLGKLPANKLCIKDGDEIEYDGYAGMWAVKASNAKRFTIIDRDKTPLTEEDEKLYAGCYVNAIIEPWFQSNNYGKRVNANLLGIQFSRDGESFESGVKVTEDDFDNIADEEDEY